MTTYLNRQQSREVDRLAVQEYGISSLVLMENAGRGVADVMQRIGIEGKVVICCGKGNNAGDGYVLARHLALRGFQVKVLQIAATDQLRGDAQVNFSILKKVSHDSDRIIIEFSDVITPQSITAHLTDADWVVDALLGTGAIGEPRAPYDLVIDQMNQMKMKKMAIDLPSGLDCDSGQPSATTFKADHTCTFVAKKIGFRNPIAKEYLGEIHICDIGIPHQFS